ncbi:MAG: hypothetical protein SPH36_08135 [Candidatus Cryptobacteroides sp.]|nr:hypothetical protein [Candidatus Cryptobacteroides sp.]
MALAEAEPPVSATTAAPSVTAAPAVVPSPAAALRSLFSLFFISQFIFLLFYTKVAGFLTLFCGNNNDFNQEFILSFIEDYRKSDNYIYGGCLRVVERYDDYVDSESGY